MSLALLYSVSEFKKNIVLIEIKSGRQVFFLETDKKRFFSPQNRQKNFWFSTSAVFDHPKSEQNTYGTNKTDTHKIEAKIMAFT